jgi:hypothetical protein
VIRFHVPTALPEAERPLYGGSYGGYQFFGDSYEIGGSNPGQVKVSGSVVTKSGKRHATQRNYRQVFLTDIPQVDREAILAGVWEERERLRGVLARDEERLAEIAEQVLKAGTEQGS